MRQTYCLAKFALVLLHLPSVHIHQSILKALLLQFHVLLQGLHLLHLLGLLHSLISSQVLLQLLLLIPDLYVLLQLFTTDLSYSLISIINVA